MVTFQELEKDVFDPVRKRIREGKSRLTKQGADYLAYSLIDAIVDHYFIVLENLGEQIEFLEEELVTDPDPGTLQSIHELKRELIFLRKSVWPLREVIGALERGESAAISGIIPDLPAGCLRPHHPDHRHRRDLPGYGLRDAGYLPLQHQQPHE